MSSSTDMGHGSGDFVYTSPLGYMPTGGNRIGIHPKAFFRRTDLRANWGDQYGKKNADGKKFGPFEKIKKYDTDLHEVMAQGMISLTTSTTYPYTEEPEMN